MLVTRFASLPLIIATEGECHDLHGTLHEHGCQVKHDLEEVGCLCTTVRAGALKDLCCCSGVTRVWLDGKVHACLDTAVRSAGAVRAINKYKGTGVTIAVVDTGIYRHPDFASRIIAFADFVSGKKSPYDDNGHGTHVAGCAAGDGRRSGGRYRGPAPGALLAGVKVLDKTGSGSMSGVLAGINWVIANRARYKLRIMSISLGGAPAQTCGADPLCLAVGRAWQAGIVVVVAAGNEGPGPGTISTPGVSPVVITVGAMDDRNTVNRSDDRLAGFSSRGPTPESVHKPDILAPGVSITAARSPGSVIDRSSPGARVGAWYLRLSGTSMATPCDAATRSQRTRLRSPTPFRSQT